MAVPVLRDVAHEEAVIIVGDGHAHLPPFADLTAIELEFISIQFFFVYTERIRWALYTSCDGCSKLDRLIHFQMGNNYKKRETEREREKGKRVSKREIEPQ